MVEQVPAFSQEDEIIRQLLGKIWRQKLLILAGKPGCGKTIAALILARFQDPALFEHVYWLEANDLSTLCFPTTKGNRLIVVDDFLGKCHYESFLKWRHFLNFLVCEFLYQTDNTYFLLTTRTSILEELKHSLGAESVPFSRLEEAVTLSLSSKKMWKSTMVRVKIQKLKSCSPPSIGFPLCFRLAPHLSQDLLRNFFQNPKIVLRRAITKTIRGSDVAKPALALLAVTEGYLNIKVLLDPSKLKKSTYLTPLQCLGYNSIDKDLPEKISRFYETHKGFILIQDEFVSFITETIREAALCVLCNFRVDFLAKCCSLRLLSRIATSTVDISDNPEQTEKPILSYSAKSAFLQRLLTELGARKYHEVFLSRLFHHISFMDTFKEEMTEGDLVKQWMNTYDQNGLHFLFYAGALDVVFQAALPLLDMTDLWMVLQALLGCCYWGRDKEIPDLLKSFENAKDIQKALQKATIEDIVTGTLPGISSREAPAWEDTPVYPEDTLLTMAARRGKNGVVVKLVEGGMALNSQGKNGCTALMHYCARGNKEMVKFLIERKADCSLSNEDDMTPLMYALQRKEWEVPQELFNDTSIHQVNCFLQSSLMLACAKGWSTQTIEKLITSGAEVDLTDREGYTCLHHACVNGHANVVDYLLGETSLDATQAAKNGHTPLMLAVSGTGRSQLVQRLVRSQAVKKSIDVHTIDIACSLSDKAIVQLILAVSIDHASNTRNEFTRHALASACRRGNWGIVQSIPSRKVGPDLVQKGLSYLHWACMGVSEECVWLFLQKCDKNATSVIGQTPLMTALEKGRVEFASLLQKLGARLDIRDDFGNHCLHYAVLGMYLSAVQWCIDKLKIEVDVRNVGNQTPLHLACSTGNDRVVKYLLNKGADPTIRDAEGNTCLHAAARNGHICVLEILLNGNLFEDLDVPNVDGKTSLQLATERGDKIVEKYLRKKISFLKRRQQ